MNFKRHQVEALRTAELVRLLRKYSPLGQPVFLEDRTYNRFEIRMPTEGHYDYGSADAFRRVINNLRPGLTVHIDGHALFLTRIEVVDLNPDYSPELYLDFTRVVEPIRSIKSVLRK